MTLVYAKSFAGKKMQKLLTFSAKIPVNQILYLLEQLTFWPLTSPLSQRCFEQLGPVDYLATCLKWADCMKINKTLIKLCFFDLGLYFLHCLSEYLG